MNTHHLKRYLFGFFIFTGIASASNIQEMREEAAHFYQKSKYLKAEECWDKILDTNNKTDGDMRKAAAVYYQNQHYTKANRVYDSLIEQGKDTIDDLNNFLFSIDSFILTTQGDLEIDFVKKALQICEKVQSNSCGLNEEYVVNRVFKKIKNRSEVKTSECAPFVWIK